MFYLRIFFHPGDPVCEIYTGVSDSCGKEAKYGGTTERSSAEDIGLHQRVCGKERLSTYLRRDSYSARNQLQIACLYSPSTGPEIAWRKTTDTMEDISSRGVSGTRLLGSRFCFNKKGDHRHQDDSPAMTLSLSSPY